MTEGSLARLVTIMQRLRDPHDGCEWDRTQDFASIAPYTIEEAYEVADAIAAGDMAALCDELGDLQLQVVFHAAIAADRGLFTLDQVIDGICDKLERRHPHIFAGEAPVAWEVSKAAERASAPDGSALAGVARALPALLRAEKLQRRAARVGFDWPDATGPRAKVIEEIAEVDGATDAGHRQEEIGDLLFSVVNWARHLGIEPEAALRAANDKFERRFRAIETAPGFATFPLADKERLWLAAKQPD